MFAIEQKVARTAKRAGLLSGGLLLCAVGCAFLTVAAWFALLPIVGVEVGALIIAGAYLGVGCICIGVAMNKPPKPVHDHQPARSPAPADSPPIMQAFMYGLQAGAQADQRRH